MVLTVELSEKLFNNSNRAESSHFSSIHVDLFHLSPSISSENKRWNSHTSDRGKGQGRRDLFDFYLFVYRPFSRIRQKRTFWKLRISHCVFTRDVTRRQERLIFVVRGRANAENYERTRHWMNVVVFRRRVIIGVGRKREREMFCIPIDACTVITYYCVFIQFFHVACLANINTPSL